MLTNFASSKGMQIEAFWADFVRSLLSQRGLCKINTHFRGLMPTLEKVNFENILVNLEMN